MAAERNGRILLVDDDAGLRRAFARLLSAAAFDVDQAPSGNEALKLFQNTRYDVIISDIDMPGISGVELLRAVRGTDLDVPVILITGNPSVPTAVQAVEGGALRYLLKPVESEVLVRTVEHARRLQRLARLKREALEYLGNAEKLLGDRAGLEVSLARGIETLWMAYQPIVSPVQRSIVAHEALVRTREPNLPHPGALFSAAERLGRVHDVGRAIRACVAKTLHEHPVGTDIFINLHSADLFDESLYAEDAPLLPFAKRIVLEITERVALDHASDVPARIRRLRELGFRIAIDDLGAGYAGLSYFTLITPDVVKLDMSLIRNVDREPMKQKLVGSLTALCRELGMRVVAEGVETAAERDQVVALGADLLQGYLFAKPAFPFPSVNW
jgi:EAL domain-containing protein (putative c-di-GMP-specific phosphodiesterase class I)